MPSHERLTKLVKQRAALIVAKRTRPLSDDEQRWLDKQWSESVDSALREKERRVHARVPTDLKCTLNTDNGTFEARVADLSFGGARISAPAGFAAVGEALSIEVRLGDSGTVPISILGRVVRVEQRAGGQEVLGVRFAVVEPKQRAELFRFIESLMEK